MNMKKSAAALAITTVLGFSNNLYAGNNDGGIVVSVADSAQMA